MILVGIIIGIAILVAMIYLAVDKKSTLTVRFASLGAIAVMFITLVICTIIILTDNTVPVDPSTFVVGAPPPVKEDKGSPIAIILVIVLMIALFVVIAVAAMKEHKKNLPKPDATGTPSKPISNW